VDPSIIPETVQQLVANAIPNVAAMESILLLREQQDRSWTVAQLAERLYIKESEAEASMQSLLKAGLVHFDEQGYTYRPQTDAGRAAVDELAMCYKTRLIPLTRLIHSRPSKSDIHLFADVFRFRKDS
jgi:hypothetical protein